MKKRIILLLLFFSVNEIHAQKNNVKTYVGFQTGIVAPIQRANYSIPKYKIGLPSFSYAASIENRFTLNYKLNFSLQYSISYFNVMRRNLENNIVESSARIAENNKRAQEFATNINLNAVYSVKKDICVIGGLGLTRPLNFMDKNTDKKNVNFCNNSCEKSNKYSPALSPFFMIGIENSCTLFRRNLIYSVQYNIGFLPSKALPIQESTPSSTNQYMHGVNIGLKYKY